MFVVIDLFIIWHKICEQISLVIFKNRIGIPSSPVALESEISIKSFSTSTTFVSCKLNTGVFGFGEKSSSKALGQISSAKFLPM